VFSQSPNFRVKGKTPASLAASAAIHLGFLLLLWQARLPVDAVIPRYNATPLYLPASAPEQSPAPPRNEQPARRLVAPSPASPLAKLPAPLNTPSLPAPPRPEPSAAVVQPPDAHTFAPPAAAPAPPRADSFTAATALPPAAPPSRVTRSIDAFESAPAAPRVAPRRVAAAGFGDASEGRGQVARRAPAAAGFAASQSAASPSSRRETAAAGFAAPVAPPPPAARTTAGTSTQFASAVPSSGSRQAAAAQPPARTALEILYKPRPIYTEAGRQARVEGEVVLEVRFSASGTLRVGRVVRGLGYGLDQNAVRAAEGIRFRPATDRGRAVDTVALVRIAFQLAY
jgi:TonB family protein